MTALVPIAVAGETLPGLIDRAAGMLAGTKILAHVVGWDFKVADCNLEPGLAAPKCVGVEKPNITFSAGLDLHSYQNPSAAVAGPREAILNQNGLAPASSDEVLS
jgi:hypothetical protein